jgi:hypothetical protein
MHKVSSNNIYNTTPFFGRASKIIFKETTSVIDEIQKISKSD